MNTKFYQYILSFFFYLAVLGALTACGGGGGGGGNSTPTTEDQKPEKEPSCNDFTHDCSATGKPERHRYNVDNAEDSTTGYAPSEYEMPPGATAEDKVDYWTPALELIRGTSTEPNTEYHAGGGAEKIGAAYAYARGATGEGIIISQMGGAIFKPTTFLERADGGGYNEVPSPNTAVAMELNELNLITGFRARINAGNPSRIIPEGERGFCITGAINCRGAGVISTHAAGIMVATKGDGTAGIQGIAYGAKLKPIDIYDDRSAVTDEDRRKKAIEAGSGIVDATACDASDNQMIDDCKAITVMNNNNWGVVTETISFTTEPLSSGDKNVLVTSNVEYVKTSEDFTTITPTERMAWIEAVKTTVVVFPTGNNKQNTVADSSVLTKRGSLHTRHTFSWTRVNSRDGGEATNLATLHARLPKEVMDDEGNFVLQGKWLSVVALAADNGTILSSSNGCGDAMAWCLAAPGENIRSLEVTDSAFPNDYYATVPSSNGTEVAAAHVSAAVAVVASEFPNLGPAKLVSIILGTADDLGVSGVDVVYGYGRLNLAAATEPLGRLNIVSASGTSLAAGISIDNSGITLPTSFGTSLTGFTAGFTDDYNRAFVGSPSRITQASASFTLADTLKTWETPELQSIALDSNSKMQFTNYEENEDAKDTLIFTHTQANHTIGFSYNEEQKTPGLRLAETRDDLHFQKIRPIATDLMQVNSTHKLGGKFSVKNSITTGEFDTGNRFNEAMANLNYTGKNSNLTIGAGNLQEYGQFLGASGTGAYQLSDATQSTVTHLAISQNLPKNSAIKVKYTNFKTEVDMRYSKFAKINGLNANEYQLSFAKNKILGKNDSLNIELIQPFAVTDGNLQQSTVLGYTAAGGYNNVTQNYNLAPTNRRQQIRMTWQNQINLERKTKLFISMQYENHIDNVRDNEDSSILGGISTKF